MKKFLVLFSLMVFVGVYAAPALTMPKETAAKIIAVDKDKKVKVKAKKDCGDNCKGVCTPACKATCKGTKAGCCETSKADCCKDAKAGCCESTKSACCEGGKTSCAGTEGFSAACATACQGAAAIKGDTKTTEKK